MQHPFRGIVTAALGIAAGSAAWAGPCEQNYGVAGVPLVTAMVFSSHQDFSKVQPDAALKRMARAVKAEGFDGIKVNAARGVIDAYQETSGSGRIQKLRVTAVKAGQGTRVSVTFKLQAGQVAEDRHVRPGICKILRAAGG